MPATRWAVPDKPADNPAPAFHGLPGRAATIPDWHPHPWAVTAWGGQMIDSNFGDTFLFNGRMRRSICSASACRNASGVQGRCSWNSRRIFSATRPTCNRADRSTRTSLTRTPPVSCSGRHPRHRRPPVGAALAELRVCGRHRYNTSVGNYEKTYRELLATAQLSRLRTGGHRFEQLSLVGRIHHRSGAFGTYNGVKEGSNAYLVGVRYRWGQDQPASVGTEVPPPLGCPDPDRESRLAPRPSAKSLKTSPSATRRANHTGPPQMVFLRNHLPKPVNRVCRPGNRNDCAAKRSQLLINASRAFSCNNGLSIEQNQGGSDDLRNSEVLSQNRYGGVKPTQLNKRGDTKLITGAISRWRIKLRACNSPLRVDERSDGVHQRPLHASADRIDAEAVVATEWRTVTS